MGDASIQLLWANENDLDRHVGDPNGEGPFHGNRLSATGGEIDQDTHAGCGEVTVFPVEHVFWASGTALGGPYAVRVASFTPCSDVSDTPFNVRTIVDGAVDEYQWTASGRTFCGLRSGCETCQEVTHLSR